MTIAQTVPKGGNCLLFQTGLAPEPLLIRLDWHWSESKASEIDACLFLLTKDGVVASDEDFIFYNQRTTDLGYVRHLTATDSELVQGQAGFWVDVDKIPQSVTRLAITLTRQDRDHQSPPLQSLEQASLEIQGTSSSTQQARYEFSEDIQGKAALIVGEVYRYANGWKFRAVGQGFVGGLPALATHFGVHLQAETDQSTPESQEESEQVGVSLKPLRNRRSPHEILAEHTQQIKQNLEILLPKIKTACTHQINEGDTRMILNKIFDEVLGYRMEDIKTEQNIEGRRADYVLTVDGKNALVVEVKRAGMTLRRGQIMQATFYGAFSEIRWALLTNLMEWQLYRISTGDKVESHLVFTVNLKNGLDDDAAYYLTLISCYGLGRKGLLEKLWIRLSALSYESLATALLNQEIINKIRSFLSKESGISLTLNEVQLAIERNVLHLE